MHCKEFCNDRNRWKSIRARSKLCGVFTSSGQFFLNSFFNLISYQYQQRSESIVLPGGKSAQSNPIIHIASLCSESDISAYLITYLIDRISDFKDLLSSILIVVHYHIFVITPDIVVKYSWLESESSRELSSSFSKIEAILAWCSC